MTLLLKSRVTLNIVIFERVRFYEVFAFVQILLLTKFLVLCENVFEKKEVEAAPYHGRIMAAWASAFLFRTDCRIDDA